MSSSPKPCVEGLDRAIDVYEKMIHLQPIPLFSLDFLSSYLAQASECLIWSFLGLTLAFSTHDCPHNSDRNARETYMRSAEDVVWKMAAEAIPRIEVTQSLCLLALTHIKDEKETKAWMAIGMASRLESFRHLIEDSSTPDRDSMSSRCYWSLRILETLLSPQLSTSPVPQPPPPYPPSVPLPPPILSTTHHSPSPPSSSASPADLGITAYTIHLTTLWSEITTYLHTLRSGTLETPWSPTSTYSTLTTQLHKFDSSLPESHLLRNVSFTKRTPASLLHHQTYWTSWLLMQFLSHASAAITNHPFIHLVVLRNVHGVSQSRLFLQQAVDQALFHSAWVFRLVCACDELEFPVYDPLIGHVVAATATISWIFRFAGDENVARRGGEQLVICERFLGKMVAVWPHLARKLHLLRSLQSTPSTSPPETTASKGTIITFQPTLLWDLLDPKLCNTGGSDSITHNPTIPRPPGASMRVTTQFVHPLNEDQTDLRPSFPGPFEGASEEITPTADGFEQLSFDELFAQLAPDEFGGGEY
ncbi:hypothetical protein BO71DRAFT_476180 [Aspergillus ellipticus CBS 707.79]|uniref:Xylanolytic transcriptional activator regulatory domain-containing protein n=1 Tax=Aspergillus ellipticus CBS 707.79 TaxID=1448320 RepID=A0A319ETD0_9EURO|nr:hypothetical protein BO71DRAFT_476180 [Aspergillus ellipticus CBS 707.79]